jgi:TonB family protein
MTKGRAFAGIAGRLLVAAAAAGFLRASEGDKARKARVLERVEAVYPYELALKGIEGEAELQFSVDPAGLAQDVIVVRATEPDFGFAAKAMLEAWRFEPVKEDGDPAWARNQTLKVRFDSTSSDVALNASARRLLLELKKEKPAIGGAGSLDGVPWAMKTVKPVYPRDLMKGKDIAGATTVDFIVDETGAAQLPKIISSSQWEFGWAAATAILQFQFTPPTKGGAPPVFRLPARRKRAPTAHRARTAGKPPRGRGLASSAIAPAGVAITGSTARSLLASVRTAGHRSG